MFNKYMYMYIYRDHNSAPSGREIDTCFSQDILMFMLCLGTEAIKSESFSASPLVGIEAMAASDHK